MIVPCPSCDNLVEPVLRVFQTPVQRGNLADHASNGDSMCWPLIPSCPDCGKRVVPTPGEIAASRLS